MDIYGGKTGFTPDRRAFLVGLLGEDKVKAIEEGIGMFKESAEAANVGFKALLPEDFGKTTPSPASDQQPATTSPVAPFVAQLLNPRARQKALGELTEKALGLQRE